MKTILIVDDEVLIAEYLKETLHAMGYQHVILAYDKAQALDLFKKFRPDLLLLDIRMQGQTDGIAIAEYVASQGDTPFIFITAHSDQEILGAALRTRPAAYLTKPFKKVDIQAAILLATNDKRLKNLVFKDGYTTVVLPCYEVYYIESDGNYIGIVTANRKYTIRNSLAWCMEQLPEKQFKRIHRSFIVNMREVEKADSRHVFIRGRAIPKSRSVDVDF